MTTKNTHIVYKVLFTNVIDHPEKRGPTFPAVRAGLAVHTERSMRDHKDAVSIYASLLAGEEDFSGEYIRDVEVIAIDVRKPNYSAARIVRRKQRRDGRDQPWRSEV